jgi:hypothetical protein
MIHIHRAAESWYGPAAAGTLFASFARALSRGTGKRAIIIQACIG